MGDKEARALGVGRVVEVDGKEYTIAPITMGRLQELQKAAISWYKRQILSTYSENLDILGDVGEAMLREKLAEVAKWDIDDLPKRTAYNVQLVPVNEKLKEAVQAVIPVETEELSETQWQNLVASALDQELITPDTVKQLTGKKPIEVSIPYDSWWVTGCYDGMLAMIRASLVEHHSDITTQEIGNWPISSIASLAREVEQLTAPAMGNT